MASIALRGVFTALVTPFTEQGATIDWDALDQLIDLQLAGEVSGLVPCGTTGEAPTLSSAEKRSVIEHVVKRARGRVPVLAGSGTNNTVTSVAEARVAVEAGADAVMVVMPYYSKPSQEGLMAHVNQIAASVGIPIVLYNIPGRTGVELSVESTLRLLDAQQHIVGIKDATGNVNYCQELLRQAGDRVAVMCGDDALTLPLMSIGATGVISVTSNVLPRATAQVTALALAADFVAARARHLALLPVHRVLFCESSPQPTKAALEQRGLLKATLRLPLLPPSAACRAAVAETLRQYEAS